MVKEIRHTQRLGDSTSTEKPLKGEIIYSDSNTIKIGDGTKLFSQLPEFSSSAALGDGSTIVTNSSKKIQAVGTINKNESDNVSTTVFDWIGTQAQYETQRNNNQIPDDWLCFITDDVNATMGDTYTKQEIDAFLDLKASGTGNAVMTSGGQNISGEKIFITDCPKVKSTTIDYTTAPGTGVTKHTSLSRGLDKNGNPIANVEIIQSPEGNIGVGLYSSTYKNGNEVKSPEICTWVNKEGTITWTDAGANPTSTTADDHQISTTHHVMEVLKAMWPKGSIYIGTTATCPIAALIPNSVWTLVATDRVLQGSSTSHTAGSTIAAGLPNITGSVTLSGAYVQNGTGALSGSGSRVNRDDILDSTGPYTLTLNANSKSSIYQDSVTTVQPPAYVVNIWQRTDDN